MSGVEAGALTSASVGLRLLPAAPREQRGNSIELMIRIETLQGTLARRGFVDAVAAERVIDHWADEHAPLLDLLARGDRDLGRPMPEVDARVRSAPKSQVMAGG